MKELFKSLHGAIKENTLQKLIDLVGQSGMPTKAQFEAVVAYLEIDSQDLYFEPGSIVGRFSYWKDCIYYNIPMFEIEALKMFKTKEALEYFGKKMSECKTQKNYSELFSLMDKKILIPMFVKLYGEIPDEQKYDVFVNLYVRSEYGFDQFPKEIIVDAFSKRFASKKWESRMKDFKKKIGSVSEITIYRGQGSLSTNSTDAFSWTLKKTVAKFFADRFGSKGKVITDNIEISKVVDYIDDRSEAEIILLPKKFID